MRAPRTTVTLLAGACAACALLVGCSSSGGSSGASSPAPSATTSAAATPPVTSSQDGAASCAALGRATFAASGNTATDRTAHQVSAAAGLANAAQLAAADGSKYDGLSTAVQTTWHDVKILDFTKARADRTTALAACDALGLPHAAGTSANLDAQAGCAALVRSGNALPVPAKDTVQRVAAAADLADAAALGDPTYEALATPARAASTALSAGDLPGLETGIRTALAACGTAGLPH